MLRLHIKEKKENNETRGTQSEITASNKILFKTINRFFHEFLAKFEVIHVIHTTFESIQSIFVSFHFIISKVTS